MPRRAPIPRLIRPLVPLISWLTARYIAYHRRRLLPQSMAIPDRMIARMRAFFPASVLAETRIVQARMPDPILYPGARVRYQGNAPDVVDWRDYAARCRGLSRRARQQHPVPRTGTCRAIPRARMERVCATLRSGISGARWLRRNSAGAAGLSARHALRSVAAGIVFRRRRSDPVALGWQALDKRHRTQAQPALARLSARA